MGPLGESACVQSFCGDLPCTVLFSPLCSLFSEHNVSPFQGESYFHNKWGREGGHQGAERNIGFVRKGQI